MLGDYLPTTYYNYLHPPPAYKTQEYYFIAANVFCETVFNKCYPAEVALIKFTLQDGIIETFHTYVSPGNICDSYLLNKF